MEKKMATRNNNWKFFLVYPRFSRLTTISPAEKLLLGYLLFRQGKNPNSHWAIEIMAEDLGLSEKTVDKCIKRLSKLTYITIGKVRIKNSFCNTYSVNMGNIPQGIKYPVKDKSKGYKQKSHGVKTEVLPGKNDDSTGYKIPAIEEGVKEQEKEKEKDQETLSSPEDPSQPQITEEKKERKGRKGFSGYRGEDPMAGWPADVPHICPKCQGNIVQRSGKNGQFWTCVNWPRCDYKPKKKKIPHHIQVINDAPWTQDWLKNQLPDD